MIVVNTYPTHTVSHLHGMTLSLLPALTCRDSMSKDFFKAIRCFMVEFQDLATYQASSNFTAMHLLDSTTGNGAARCVHMPQHTRLC
jgi:hypothetical protein